MCVDDLAFQDERAAADSRQVEEVVDEPGFQEHVAANHLQNGAKRIWRVGVGKHCGDGGEHRGQRRAELVAQGGQKAVLGAVGGLGLGAGRLLAEHPDPFLGGTLVLGDVAQHQHPAQGIIALAQPRDPRVEP